MSYNKWNINDPLRDDRDDTYATILETLDMSATDVYIVRKTH